MWTVRTVAGTPLGFAWGVACIAAGLRWGTLSLGDVGVATRVLGPTLTSGTYATRAGMAMAIAGAVLSEARVGGFLARTWGERAAASAAVAALAPLFVATGASGSVWGTAVPWAASAAVFTAGVVLLHRVALRIPAFVPIVVTSAGAMIGLMGS